ncbi:MAG TPA: hypothetical protein VFI95_10930 [Terriglobales bacterium]|nr:hypothetical protein [Terriglobales bacterium]
MAGRKRPKGFLALGIFFYFGAVMAAYAAITLLRPGTFLDGLWVLNPQAHVALRAFGPSVAAPFSVLAIVLVLAGLGWFRHQYWGWLLGTFVIGANCAADLIHVFLGDWLRSGVGFVIAGLLLWYLTSAGVRRYFLPQPTPM